MSQRARKPQQSPLPPSPPSSGWVKVMRAVTRDLVLFTVGLLLLINEAVIRSEPPRESLLIVYTGMMGLPAILRFDQIRRNGRDEK